MAELTQEQARTLADGFFAVSKSVGDFRLDHFAEIPDAEQIQLRSLQKDLAQRSIDLTADAIRITLDDLKPTLARIGEVTKQVNEAVEKLTRREREFMNAIFAPPPEIAKGTIDL